MSGTIQTDYTAPKGLAGGVVNSANVRYTDNKSAHVTKRGKFVKVDAAGSLVALTAIADTVKGVIIRDDAFSAEAVATGDMVRVAQSGVIFVNCETAAVKDQAVHVRFIVNGGTEVGDVLNVADGVNTEVLAGATFAETTTAAGLVAINLNI